MKTSSILFGTILAAAHMISCSKPREANEEETPPIINSGLSFGPYRPNEESPVKFEIRVKYVDSSKPEKSGELSYILEMTPTSGNESDFGKITNILCEREKPDPYTTSLAPLNFLNHMEFTLKDKDGFEIEKARVPEKYTEKEPSVYKEASKQKMEYTGTIRMSKQSALRIKDCDFFCVFKSEARRALGIKEQ